VAHAALPPRQELRGKSTPRGKGTLSMQNILHWIGVALAFLVLIGGIRFFLRGLSQKPSDPSTRVPDTWQSWWRP
jgi:hypothetical protein